MRPVNEGWHYPLTPFLIGWPHTQNNPCMSSISVKCHLSMHIAICKGPLTNASGKRFFTEFYLVCVCVLISFHNIFPNMYYKFTTNHILCILRRPISTYLYGFNLIESCTSEGYHINGRMNILLCTGYMIEAYQLPMRTASNHSFHFPTNCMKY